MKVAGHPTRISALAQMLTLQSASAQQHYLVEGPGEPELTTNRDLYLHVLRTGRDARAASWSLSAFLRSLWKVSAGLRGSSAPTPDEVGALFSAAGSTPPPPFDPAWSGKDLDLTGDPAGYADWERVLLAQIADLEDFVTHPQSAAGTGVQAPRPPGSGARPTPAVWRNFDPASYCECAVAGAFGGWHRDDGARLPRPGSPDHSPVRDLTEISWLELSRLIVCGQIFE
ncbi:hypothetical protein [Actinocorallia populi]|uniref:hypothetical protein n=1 Tax=Actinocorallia populi TaxID=2079200 RepID=UPI001E5FAD0E|nr:hypothetical protein [Actinocorallia populi]